MSTTSFSAIVASIGDPDGTRTIAAIVALLVVIGIGLSMLAIWLFKTTRPDPELLAPLDVMGERKWRRADPVWQRRRLDEVRPTLARPLSPSVAPPEFDAAFDQGPTASGFDDLHDEHPAQADHTRDGADDHKSDDAPAEPDGSNDTGDDTASDDVSDDLDVDDDEAAEPEPDNDDREHPLPGAGTTTPTGIVRPRLDDLPDHELDPALLAMAMRDLDEELAARRHLIEGDDQR